MTMTSRLRHFVEDIQTMNRYWHWALAAGETTEGQRAMGNGQWATGNGK